MRVKVETVAPLPHVKAWFSANTLPTIHDLKTSFCTDLQPLKHASIRPQDLILLLDDFELLESSPIDVVHDGDLIIIKKAPISSQHKRKNPPQDVSSPARKRTKTDGGRASSKLPTEKPPSVQRRNPSPTSSGSSSDSSSDSDTDTSDPETATSDSDDSESSTSSSSTSTSSAPSVKTSRHKSANGVSKTVHPAPKAQITAATRSIPPTVPPGLGKPSTHSRNIRRRRKKMYERLTATAEPASVNKVPLGTRASTLQPLAALVSSATPPPESELPQTQKGKETARVEVEATAEPPLFMMASLQNKNKRRGFKEALTRGVPTKIIFEYPEGDTKTLGSGQEQVPRAEADPDALMVEASLQVPEAPQRARQPRLVPPSEKQELGLLPPNMFVTSVDVEAGMWPRRKNKKKKQKARPEEAWGEEEEGDAFADGLPYDDEAAEASAIAHASAAEDTSSAVGTTERAVVAAQWDSLRKITDKAQLVVGATVAWKALGINFTTLTPEMLLHVGRISGYDELQLVVEFVAEAGVADVSFGGPVDTDEGGAVEETFGWTDVLQGDWRLVVSR